MPAERVLSSYILRLTQRRSRVAIELRDVRTGEATEFASFELLARHLQAAVSQGPKPPVPPAGEES